MNVFSGKCEHGKCGLETDMIDGGGEKLEVGDIVTIASQDEMGIMCFYGISAVCEDRPTP